MRLRLERLSGHPDLVGDIRLLTEIPAEMELVRLAIPRRTYTQSHIDYVGEVIAAVAAQADQLTGLRIVEQAPWLRHFTAALAPLA